MYGAVFLDAGNVWAMHDDTERAGAKFEAKNFFKQMAVGTGIGLRYDLTYFILRLDWGIGLHVPYETSKSGFYNIDSFKDTQTFHLAIGLPF
jgi:outer membrane protein assembly factor BamA